MSLMLATQGCGSSEDSVFVAGDSAGQSRAQYFYEDYTDTPAIYVIVPVPDGATEDPIKVSIRIHSLYGVDMERAVPNPILFATVKGIDAANPHRVAVRFPDPGTYTKKKTDDPSFAETVQELRAVGKYTAIVERSGNTETADFQILPAPPSSPQPPIDDADVYYDTDQSFTTDPPPPAGQCTSDTVQTCPLKTFHYATRCCTTSSSCGTGFLGTGLCY
ncbi:MAG: hypothetical protein ACRELY_28335 [Polyangiaceae bacterium]